MMQDVCVAWLVTNAERTKQNAGHELEAQKKNCFEKKCLLRLKYGYLSYKNTRIRYSLFTPRSLVKGVLLRMRTLYFTSSELLKKTPAYPHWKAWRGQDHFYITDWILLKEESHIHLGE